MGVDRAAGVAEEGAQLAVLFAESRRIVVLTGAGLSTECGVPDFRSPGSPWTRHKPIGFQDFLSSVEQRHEAWRRKFTMDDLYAGAAPGRGHRALADLARTGRLKLLVTQNIDNLHQASGVPQEMLVELHGNGSYAACLACGERHELGPIRARLAEAREGEPATCEACGGIVKSATIAFGQALPEEALRRAVEASLYCDLMLVVGSSLVVNPAARLPVLAKSRGATLAVLNREPTPADSLADLVLRGDVGPLLEQAVAKLRPSVAEVKKPL